MARYAVDVRYVTAMGTDALSEMMLRCWQAEGIDNRGGAHRSRSDLFERHQSRHPFRRRS